MAGYAQDQDVLQAEQEIKKRIQQEGLARDNLTEQEQARIQKITEEVMDKFFGPEEEVEEKTEEQLEAEAQAEMEEALKEGTEEETEDEHAEYKPRAR